MSDINEFQVNHGSNEDERQEFMNAYKNYVVAVVKEAKEKYPARGLDQASMIQEKLQAVQSHLFEHQKKEMDVQSAKYPSLEISEIKQIAELDEDDAFENHLQDMDRYLMSHFSLAYHKDMEKEAGWMQSLYEQNQRSNATPNESMVFVSDAKPTPYQIDLLNQERRKLNGSRSMIQDADPIYIKSSSQYKGLKSAMNDLYKDGNAALNDLEKGVGSLKSAIELINLADKAQKKANEYTTYKNNALNGKEPNSLERSRMAAASNAAETAKSMKSYVRETVLDFVKDKTDLEKISAVEQLTWNTGEMNSRKMAEMIYLQGMRQSVKSPSSKNITLELNENVMNNGVDKIMKSSAFKEMEKNFTQTALGDKEFQANVYRAFAEAKKRVRADENTLDDAPSPMKEKGKEKNATPESKTKTPLIM